ncbi:hypothetical protein [Ignavibacterium sp.]|jgi:hypothetical protein|uniref:hypothetical protein n=1 Tax=Ignavibacterium sp. TaxID=2651167 RepID=UPI0025C30F35|nr:hypothetical protein [Ignavibacterium sp.]
MGGKVSLFLVMGFAGLFALFSKNIMDTSTKTVDNYAFYFSKSQAHHIAVSGIHMAMMEININDPKWTTGFSNKPFSGGYLDLYVANLASGILRLTSIGRYGSYSDTVVVTAKQRSYAEYGNYYNVFSNVWAATGDTFDGKFHANDFIQCYGDPVFKGVVTTSKGVKLYDKKSHPKFEDGWKLQTNDPVKFDTAAMRIDAYAGGKVFRDTTNKNKITDVRLIFNSDGTVKYSVSIDGKPYTPEVTVPLTDLAPNGLIYIERGNAHIKGTLDGQVTIVASKKGTTGAGRVLIDNTIQYEVDPLEHPDMCDDYLGLVAEQQVEIPFDPTRGDFTIHASMLSQNGGLVVTNYSSYPGAYKMNIVGGIIGHKVEATATYAWDPVKKQYVPKNGYSYIHKYDKRFDIQVPPYFPKMRIFSTIAWYEGEIYIPVF